MVTIRGELREYGLVPRKGLGQHFLIDRNILNKIIRTAGIEKEDTVLEVGSGLGEMTLALAHQARKVISVEIDPKLSEILKKKTEDCPNVDVLRHDILEIDFNEFRGRGWTPIKVVANLPYQISTPLLFRFVEARQVFSTLTLMLQREVAERMVASPGTKEYGPLSIFLQLYSSLSIRFLVKPNAFFPPPRVESAVVHMVWRETPAVELSDAKWFKDVVRGCFNYRRKTLRNALNHSGICMPQALEEKLRGIGLDPRQRPETLTIEEFGRLTDMLKGTLR